MRATPVRRHFDEYDRIGMFEVDEIRDARIVVIAVEHVQRCQPHPDRIGRRLGKDRRPGRKSRCGIHDVHGHERESERGPERASGRDKQEKGDECQPGILHGEVDREVAEPKDPSRRREQTRHEHG